MAKHDQPQRDTEVRSEPYVWDYFIYLFIYSFVSDTHRSIEQ